MGKLYGMTAYLIGSMDLSPDRGVGWRKDITPSLHKLGVMVYNPCSKPVENPLAMESEETTEIINALKEDNKFKEIREKYKHIRNVDLRMVDTADFLIAYIDLDIHTCGTYEEIVTANRSKKPVLVVCKQGTSRLPNWLLFMLPDQHLFCNMEELVDYLGAINRGWDDETNRWVFFDMGEELKAIEKYKDYYDKVSSV